MRRKMRRMSGRTEDSMAFFRQSSGFQAVKRGGGLSATLNSRKQRENLQRVLGTQKKRGEEEEEERRRS